MNKIKTMVHIMYSYYYNHRTEHIKSDERPMKSDLKVQKQYQTYIHE